MQERSIPSKPISCSELLCCLPLIRLAPRPLQQLPIQCLATIGQRHPATNQAIAAPWRDARVTRSLRRRCRTGAARIADL